MAIHPFDRLRCPLDNHPLRQEQGSWRCSDGHSFDIARQGYVHLLPVQKKRSRDPGDSKDMVAARRRFLNAGYYRPIALAVTKAVLADARGGDALSCLDAGCGEGYYLRELADAAAKGPDLSLLGLDISKWAVQAAAGQDKRPSWVVGSNANLPVESGSLDRLLCLFGFPVYPEFARVLKPGGQLLRVGAGPEHLRQLREIVYPELKPERQQRSEAPEGFRELATEAVDFPLVLDDSGAIADLLAMTPHLYRANAEGRARAAALTELTLTVAVQVTRLERVR
ncbi:23S rRNA m(1)G-745 methyltransferase [Marinobacter daqiaonensis]|uniref:23S rRNA m(1)G-745 methyltransferase n=1 Tax=Marinobacter daqiaonensis TaxID=650891 RepID=A0A1I6HJI1_9GAMM|nr:methyltransferase domain-containing protein [Marinobacter daqiaonensis]SFR54568.1 23S rRNA m(1)G-745 methyltransferase [Marinobacter daqiaonensis]